MAEKKISIIGTGEYARALAKRLLTVEYDVLCGSRHPDKKQLTVGSPSLADVQVVTISDCIKASDIIFMCVHADAHKGLIDKYREELTQKIIVDVSNPRNKRTGFSVAEGIQQMLPSSYVVKAFNTVSAYELESEFPIRDQEVLICGDDHGAKKVVKVLARDMGFKVSNCGGLHQSRQLEQLPAQIFVCWRVAAAIAAVVSLVWAVFAIIRLHVVDKLSWGDLPLITINKVFACNAVTLLFLCYLPACLTALIQIRNGTKYKPLQKWMNSWFKARKQLGLFALLSAVFHVFFSLLALQPGYLPWLFNINIPENAAEGLNIPVTPTITIRGRCAIVFGAFSLACLTVLAITSIPAVGKLMNLKEWRFIQSQLGWFGFFLAGSHPSILNQWGIFLTTSFFCLILPYISLVLKFIITIPCVNSYLWKIRRGYERGNKTDKASVRVSPYP